MSKKSKTPLGIFMESIGLYFSNFDKFFKYMTFPVLGQILGITLVFLLTFFYTKNLPNILEKFSTIDNPSTLFIILFLIVLPGLIIFMKAFWEYLVAYGAVNSMLENLLKSGKVYDFDAHTELIKRRTVPFIGLWFLFSIYSAISIIPFFWIPAIVFAVFFILIFQVFTYEPELTPIGCAKRSFALIKGHFASTFLLLALVGALTYVFIPQLLTMFCDYTHITKLFINAISPFVKELPINDLNSFFSSLYLPQITTNDISEFIIEVSIAQIFIQYTLPLRSILWGMWYKELNGGKLYISSEDKPKKTSKKKPSEKLMKSSNKKYSSKKIDRNILKRAMEKDDNE
ncbi:hypothetical protein IJ384_03950 [bacterium]|nr:hypothetical protein [bacterium]